jgi:phage repressor protein C with HTH and peptisase S24 domain
MKLKISDGNRFLALIQLIQGRLTTLSLSEQAACKAANVHIDTLRMLRNGHAPDVSKLRALATVLRIPAEILVEAASSGSITPDRAPVSEPSRNRLDFGAGDQLPAPAGYVPIPTLDIRAGAGGGGFLDEDLMGDPVYLPAGLIEYELKGKPADFVALYIEGQSMAPILESGDQVLIDRRKVNPSMAGLFVLWDGFGVVAKWVSRVQGTDPAMLEIQSENKRFATYTITADEARIIGRIVWFARRI